jgi:hypothetical protein
MPDTWTPPYRLDALPHRGELQQRLGRWANGCGFFCWLMVPGVFALVVGVVVWLAARHDLRRMARDEMDPAGWALTEKARWHAGNAVVITLACILVGPVLVLLVWLGVRVGWLKV